VKSGRKAVKASLWAFAAAGFVCLGACGHSSVPAPAAAVSDAAGQRTAVAPAAAVATAPAPDTTGGFDGARAYKHVEQLVDIGPHPSGSEAITRAQQYISGQLKSFGCPVEEQSFHATGTPVGDVAMKNIVVKIPSSNPNIILYGSHYDTKRLAGFVGADDAGSSSGVLLELARLLCARKNAATIWLVFFDGEEDFNFNWGETNTYGSREMAASLANSGDLKRVKAMVLVDMVGPFNPVYKRETDSTPWLVDLIWSTAARLGYARVFVNDGTEITDDHDPFLKRNVPSVDIIDMGAPVMEYWHTPEDTLDKIDPHTLAITGHVLIESLPELEKKAK
jgi:glutaminyl-peptide cyclotransferase